MMSKLCVILRVNVPGYKTRHEAVLKNELTSPQAWLPLDWIESDSHSHIEIRI